MSSLAAAAILAMVGCGPDALPGAVDDADGWDVSALALGADGGADFDDANEADEDDADPDGLREGPRPRIDLPHCRELADAELADALRACGQDVRACAEEVEEDDREAKRGCFDAGRACALELGVVVLPPPPGHRRRSRPEMGEGPNRERPERPEIEIPEDALCVIHPRPPGAHGPRGPRDRP